MLENVFPLNLTEIVQDASTIMSLNLVKDSVFSTPVKNLAAI